MDVSGKKESLLERHWYWLVVLFGLIFAMCLDFFHPTH